MIPGLIVAALFMGWIAFRAVTTPSVTPESVEQVTWRQRFIALKDLVPVVFLIACVIGSMYAGLASVTEAAAVGVGGALLVATMQRTLTWANLKSSLFSTVRTCSMIGLILCGALFMAKARTFLGIPAAVSAWVTALKLSPYMLIFVLLIVYLILGTALDGLSAMVMTLPVALPLIAQAGFDKVWFGIFIVVTIELSNVSPPVGFNLFVIQQMTGDTQTRVARASLPFCVLLCVFVAAMTVYPEIATWLPATMKAK